MRRAHGPAPMGSLRGKDYSQLFELIEAAVADDDFALFDLAKARRFATSEVLAYETATRSLDAATVGLIDARMPWLRRPRRNREPHCACAPGVGDERLDGDFAICLTCGVHRTHIVLDAAKEPYGVYHAPPRRYLRSNRFRIVLLNFVEGCTASAPHHVAEAVRARLVRARLSPERATCVQVRRALRALQLGEYYAMAPGIAAQISGAPRLRLTTYEINSMRCIFTSVEQNLGPIPRTYMPSYGMLIAAMLERSHPEAAERYAPILSHARTRNRVRAMCEAVVRRVVDHAA